jgi:uncharacterized delta-60 repeat protein
MLLASRRLCRGVARCAICALALLVPLVASAVPFGDNGIAIPSIYIPGGDSIPRALVVQADGKTIIVGDADGPIARTMFAARFTAAGTLDASFGTNGVAFVPVPEDADELHANAAALDAQGNVVLAGYVNYPYPYSEEHVAIARLTSTGGLDPTFSSRGYTEVVLGPSSNPSYATTVAVDPLGHIVVGMGGFTVVRLDSSGTLDTTFNGTGVSSANVSPFPVDVGSLVVDANSNIVFSGAADFPSGSAVAVAKLTASGQLDPSFNGTGIVQMPFGSYGGPFPLALNPDGSILVGGEFSDGYHQIFLLQRLTSTGAIDASFGSGGLAQFEPFYPPINAGLASIGVDGLGRIVLLANASSGMYALRFVAGGSVDSSFNGTGITQVFPQDSLSGPGVMAIDANDNIVVAGSQNSPPSQFMDAVVARLTPTGAFDPTFNGNGVTVASCGVKQVSARGLALQPDGKLVLAGATGVPGGDSSVDFVVARLTPAGTLDPTFNGAGFRAIDITPTGPDSAYAVALDKIGNIVVAGQAGTGDIAVVRLTPSGTLDTSFNGTGTSVVGGTAMYNGGATSAAIDTGGNVVVVGQVPVGNKSAFGVVRLTSAGTLDTSFGGTGSIAIPVGTYGDNQPTGVGIDSFGRIVVGGWFQDLSSCGQFVALRLTQGGVLDTTFAGTGIKVVSEAQGCLGAADGFAIDASDRVMLAGFTTVARLTSAGNLDPSLGGTGVILLPEDAAPVIHAIASDSNGKSILVGDAFFADSEFRVARLAADGTIDATFNLGRPVTMSAFQGTLGDHAYAVALDGAGQTYVAGTAGRAMAIVKLFGGAPMTLSIVSINGGGNLIAKTPFDVLVQALDEFGSPQPVTADTTVTLSHSSEYGALGGNLTCVIPAGSTTCPIVGATFSISYQGVVLTASATTGDALDPIDSGLLNFGFATASVGLASSPNPSTADQPVAITATVTGADPTGSVVFYIDSGLIFAQCGWVTLSGSGNTKTAVCTQSGLPSGVHTLYAVYTGDAANVGAYSATLSQVVNPVPPSSLVNPSFETPALGSGFQYNLSGAGVGWTFSSGSGIQGNGSAWGAAPAPSGTQTAFIQSTSSISQPLSLNAGNYTLAFKAAQRNCCLTPNTQPIQVTVDGTQIGSLITPASTSFSSFTILFTVLFRGVHTIAFMGTNPNNNATFIDAVTLTAIVPGTALVSSLNPSNTGDNVTFTATVTGSAPTGSVTFVADSVTTLCSAVPLSGGGNTPAAQCSTSSLSAGTHSIVASYSGDIINPASSSAPLSQVVNSVVPPPALVNVSFETPALVSGFQYDPSGAGVGWTFTSGSGIQHNGSAWGAAATPEGAQTAFIQNTSSISQALSLNAGSYTLSFKAAQRPCCLTPNTQPIQVSIDGTPLGSPITPASTSFGAFSIPISLASSGTHTIAFAGTNPNSNATFIDAVSVTALVPGTTLASSLNPARRGQNVTFTATVTGTTPTGTVGFTSNGTPITGCTAASLSAGSGNVRTAKCVTSFATAGTFNIVANYSGDGGNAPSSTAPLAEVVKSKK